MIVLFFFLKDEVPTNLYNTEEISYKRDLQVDIGGTPLSTTSIATIFTSTLQPVIKFRNDTVTSASIDGSANVLFDDFYGQIKKENNSFVFQPNYNLNPGLHQLKLETASSTFEYEFRNFSKNLNLIKVQNLKPIDMYCALVMI